MTLRIQGTVFLISRKNSSLGQDLPSNLNISTLIILNEMQFQGIQ